MLLFRTILCVLVTWTATAIAAADLERANREFEAGRFDSAKQQFEELLTQGAPTANLYYNLGNAEFRLGSIGRAVLDYERALALQPSHPEARRNLQVAREKAGARVPERRWYDVLFPESHPNAYAISLAVFGWATALSLTAIMLRYRAAILPLIAGFSFLGVIYSATGLWFFTQDSNLGIVLPKEAVARVAPAEQSSLAGTLTAGSRVRVLTVRGDWVYCELPSDALGWLPAASVERVRFPS